jgi:hypothetical protein
VKSVAGPLFQAAVRPAAAVAPRSLRCLMLSCLAAGSLISPKPLGVPHDRQAGFRVPPPTGRINRTNASVGFPTFRETVWIVHSEYVGQAGISVGAASRVAEPITGVHARQEQYAEVPDARRSARAISSQDSASSRHPLV